MHINQNTHLLREPTWVYINWNTCWHMKCTPKPSRYVQIKFYTRTTSTSTPGNFHQPQKSCIFNPRKVASTLGKLHQPKEVASTLINPRKVASTKGSCINPHQPKESCINLASTLRKWHQPPYQLQESCINLTHQPHSPA